ncbi:MAG: 1-acyl-sn-glycerol-3-phosphate acyltransferase, partial [Clostridiales bacterium]|nr:1-acyl-sn-glycerol-3-phosphate acyltransferase [Clostridiales bacterium]
MGIPAFKWINNCFDSVDEGFDSGKRTKGKAAKAILKAWTNSTLFVFGVKVNVYGRENVSSPEGKVYISNHASYLDIFVLLAKVPDNLRMIYKKEINKMPLISWAMRACGFVPIDRKNVRT